MCGDTLAKCFLVALNIGFFLLGLLLLLSGVLVVVDPEDLLGQFDSIPIVHSVSELIKEGSGLVDENLDSQLTALLENSGWVLIGVGAVIFILGFLGVCGACRENKLYLWVYSIIVLVILLAEIALVIFVVVERDSLEDDIVNILDKTLEEYEGMEWSIGGDGELDFKVSSDPVTFAWDIFQVTLGCCGVRNYSDYANFDWVSDLSENDTDVDYDVLVPATCCKTIRLSHFPNKLDRVNVTATRQCMEGMNSGQLREEGCYDKVRDLVESYFYYIIGVVAGIIVLQILAVVFACVMAKQNKNGISPI